MATYNLSLARNYVMDWSVTDAVREIIQNAVDNEGGWAYTFVRNAEELTTLSVISYGAELPASTLLLGNSGKAKDKDKIGQFGEGYKLAALVLLRNEKKLFVIHSDNKSWKFRFAYNSEYGADVLQVLEDPMHNTKDDQLQFVITGLSDEEVSSIKQMYLPAHEKHAVIKHKTPFGNILANKAGMLFVKGLFVCKTELFFGYDLNPDQIQLGRDRQVVDSWDLRWKTKDLWMQAVSGIELLRMMRDEVPDVELIQHVPTSSIPGLSEAIKNMIFSGSRVAYFPASSEVHKELHIKNGVPASKIMIIPHRLMQIVENQEWYGKLFKKNTKKKEPRKVLQDWLKRNDTHLTNYGKKNFVELLEESKQWLYK